MEIMYNSMNPASNIPDEDALKHIIDTGTDGIWVGEDAILCAADYLRRDMHVYLAAGKSPFIYSPQSGSPTFNALSIAFYEPGHYSAVKTKPQNSVIGDNLDFLSYDKNLK